MRCVDPLESCWDTLSHSTSPRPESLIYGATSEKHLQNPSSENPKNWKTGLRSVKKADFCDDRGHAAGNRTVYRLISLQLLFFYWLCCFVFYAARCFCILRVLGLWTFFCRKKKRSWKKRTHTQRRRARYAESFDVLLSQGAYAEWKVVCEIIFWLMLKLSENKAWKAVKWFTL